MSTLENRLTEMLEPAVAATGYELLGIEFVRAGKHSTLRIYIDSADGVDVDGCADVSHQVSAILDVEDPISTEYNLEVSSPGLDRPLFNAKHYLEQLGQIVKLQLVMATDGRRKFKGEIVAVDGSMITLSVDGKEYTFAISNIKQANIVPQFD